ncbi:hypothetical protein HMI56_002666, partial [Coelomomyces lativittatus]
MMKPGVIALVPLIPSSHYQDHVLYIPATSTATIPPMVLNPLFSCVINITGEFSNTLLATQGTLYMEVYALLKQGHSTVYRQHPGYYYIYSGLPIKIIICQE